MNATIFSAMTSAPYSLVRSGLYDYGSGALGVTGMGGYLWSSTAYDAHAAYFLLFYSSDVSPGTNNNGKGFGFPVRCVAEQTFQDFTADNAAAMVTNSRTILTDSRDGKRYLVAKLADDRVWMVQNLALGTGIELNSDNTNLPEGTIYEITAAMDKGTGAFANSPITVEQMASNGSNGHIDGNVDATNNTGYFYSWTTAMAGYTGTVQTSQDICPKGWRLPTGGSSGEFKTLYNTHYSSNYSNFKTAWAMALVGYYSTSGLDSSGSGVRWWSSTPNGSGSAYSMRANSSDFTSEVDSNRWVGYSIRCVAGQ